MYDVDFSIILNLAFEFIQDDNNYLHLSAIRIDVQKAINQKKPALKQLFYL